MTDTIQPAAEKAGADQLEKLADEFELWRSQKTSPAQKIPQRLLQEAQRLSEHYKASQVRRRLGLSSAQMKKLEAINKPTEQVADDTQFMRLVPHNDTVSPTKELTIEICTPKGLKVTLSGTQEQDRLAVIAKFLEG